MMPDLNGIETARRIRAMHVPSAEVPIVALVAQTKKHHINAAELHAALAPYLTRAQQSEPMLRLIKG